MTILHLVRSTALATATLLFMVACHAEPAARNGSAEIPRSDKTMPEPANSAQATFGNGCFWCTEAIFQNVDGVLTVTSGYAGGHVPNPTYEQVCTGDTGHAEIIHLTYNPAQVTYDRLLDVFFATHNPTTLNRQGNDIGTQYRSVIFPHDDEQRRLALAKIAALDEAEVFEKPIVTTIETAGTIYPAEEYHQNYFKRNPNAPYCRFVIQPKLEKFLKEQKAAGGDAR